MSALPRVPLCSALRTAASCGGGSRQRGSRPRRGSVGDEGPRLAEPAPRLEDGSELGHAVGAVLEAEPARARVERRELRGPLADHEDPKVSSISSVRGRSRIALAPADTTAKSAPRHGREIERDVTRIAAVHAADAAGGHHRIPSRAASQMVPETVVARHPAGRAPPRDPRRLPWAAVPGARDPLELTGVEADLGLPSRMAMVLGTAPTRADLGLQLEGDLRFAG